MKKYSLILLLSFISISSVFSQKGERYTKGYYYDKDANKHEGLFELISTGSTYLTEKTEKRRGKKIDLKQVDSIVVGESRLIFISDKKIDTFVFVLDRGTINLYNRPFYYYGKKVDQFILQRNGTNDFHLLQEGLYSKKSCTTLKSLISDRSDLVEKLNAMKNLECVRSTDEIIKEYNR